MKEQPELHTRIRHNEPESKFHAQSYCFIILRRGKTLCITVYNDAYTINSGEISIAVIGYFLCFVDYGKRMTVGSLSMSDRQHLDQLAYAKLIPSLEQSLEVSVFGFFPFTRNEVFVLWFNLIRIVISLPLRLFTPHDCSSAGIRARRRSPQGGSGSCICPMGGAKSFSFFRL